MKPPKSTGIIVLLFFFFAITASAQHKLISIKVAVPASKEERLDLIALLQLDHFQEAKGFIQAEIGEEEFAKLKVSNHRYTVLVADVAARLQEINKPYFEGRKNGTINIDGTPKIKNSNSNSRVAIERPGGVLDNIIFTPAAFQVQTGSPNLGGYYTFAQMNAAMDALVLAYPAIASKTSLGTTVGARNIWMIKISDNVGTDDPGEPEVYFQGIQHAREAIGGSSMIFLMQYLCEAYAAGDSKIVNLVNNREIYIVPCMNPDGWEYNRSIASNGGGAWRKNRKNIGSGQIGVDLNRNWNVDWAQCAGAVGAANCGNGTISTGNETYWGSAAFSELETTAIRNFIRSKHIVVANDQHSVGPYYSLPFGRPNLHNVPDSIELQDTRWYAAIPALMGKYNGMRAGNSVQALGYEVAGGIKDWFFKGDVGTSVGSGLKTEIYGMTGEGGYRAASSTFWPPAGEIVTLCKGMTYQNLQLLYSAGPYVDIQDITEIGLPASLTGTINFRLRRLGLENQPVTVTAIPLDNISVGPAVTGITLPAFYDTYEGSVSYTLPGSITNGQFVRYAWRIETGSLTFYDTVIKFYNPVQLLSDDMEGSFSTNWTSTSIRDSTNINPPFNTITIVSGEEQWSFTGIEKYGGAQSLTESASGRYKERATRTLTYKNTFNLSDATAGYITFWTKHKAENFHDKLQVQVSPDGSTWTTVAGRTTIQEPGTLEETTIDGQPSLTGIEPEWVKETFSISGFNGTPALRLRFVFTSDETSAFFAAEDDGFYLDDIKVMKSTVPLVTLPVRFISFTAKLTPANTVDLDWVVEADSKHSHFIAEKSINGQTWSSLGRVDNLPYKLTDYNPAIGSNYYRIKQFDIDGKFMYSKVNIVHYDPYRVSCIIYPNPASDNVTFRINTGRPEAVSVQVSDLTGKTVYTERMVISSSSGEMKVNVQGWPSQTYIVKVIRSSDNSSLSVEKFIKQ